MLLDYIKITSFRAKLAKIHKSMTVWFTGLVSLMIANFNGVVDYVRDNLPQLQQFVTSDIYKGLGIFVFLVGVYIRMKTSKGLDEK